jgi:hypothetical protein
MGSVRQARTCNRLAQSLARAGDKDASLIESHESDSCTTAGAASNRVAFTRALY